MAVTGSAVPLTYGYFWGTGLKLQGETLQNTGSDNNDFTRIGFWLLGEGEWDGNVELWDNGLGRLLLGGNAPLPGWLHFHPGCDAVIGTGQTPVSLGGDQGVDTFWSSLPSGLQVLNYNRWAYYAISLKQLINNPPNTQQNNSSVWADVNPIGIWRALKCRMFDAAGNMVDYAWTRNPAWHYVDLQCRRKLFHEYSIDAINGADDLPSAVKNRFDFGALAESASYYGETLANGMPRFAGDYSFAQKTTLQACVQQILTCSRSYQREKRGCLSIVADKPRTSVFTFSRQNADSFNVSDADLHSNASLYTAAFRDLLCPAAAEIESISFADHGKPVVTTVKPHCFVAQDYLVMGNTGTAYDTYWSVDSVPDTGGAPVYQFTLVSRGSNYPTSVGAGGLVGLRFSRFEQRNPQFQHKAFQRALGAVGAGLPRIRNRRNKTTDFAVCTWDQAARITKYQRGVELGADVSPYVTPPSATLKTPLFAPDVAGSGTVAVELDPGDVVTVDDTLAFAYAGLYEVMKTNPKTKGSNAGSGSQRTPQEGSTQLTLRPYSDSNYTDENQGNEPGWPTVPTLPGNQPRYTPIPLASGDAVFFTGTAACFEKFELPEGFNSANMLCWASPQGYVEGDQHWHYIMDCDAFPNQQVTLVYNDSAGAVWPGDVNYCGIAWRTKDSARKIGMGPMCYVELTLAGGEKVIFGKGRVASEQQVPVPSTYDVNKVRAMAFPKVASDGGKPTHGVASWVDVNGLAHHYYMWAPGETWEGDAITLVFGILNNNGTWRADANGWFHCPLPDGRVLAIALQSLYPSVPNAFYAFATTSPYPKIVATTVPALDGVTSDTIQCMPTPDGFDFVGDDAAHGVKQCTVDPNTLDVTTSFEDGDGNIWGGSTSVFSLLCDTPTSALGGDVIAADATRWPGQGSPAESDTWPTVPQAPDPSILAIPALQQFLYDLIHSFF